MQRRGEFWEWFKAEKREVRLSVQKTDWGVLKQSRERKSGYRLQKEITRIRVFRAEKRTGCRINYKKTN